MSKQLMEEDPMKRKSNITTSSKILASAILMSGFVALALHSALAAKTDAARAGKTKRIRYTATGGRQPCSGGGVFRRACPERDPRTRQHRPRQFRKIRSRTKIGRPHLLRRRKRRIQLPRMRRIRTALFSRLETTIFLSRFQS